MATRQIELEGLGVVEVDETFFAKSPEEQKAIVDSMKAQRLASQLPKNHSLGAAFESGDLQARAGAQQYLSDIVGNEPGPVRAAFNTVVDAGRSAVVNPLRQAVGLEALPSQQEQDRQEAERLAKQAQSARIRRQMLNYEPEIASAKDIHGIKDLGQFILERGASSAAPMMAATVSGGSLGLLAAQGAVNDELREIPGLDKDERLILATVAGGIIGSLDNVSLGIVLKGIPKKALAKFASPKVAEWLMKKGVAPAAIRTIAVGASEGSTELIQEGVQIGAASIGGKEFTSDEIMQRGVEATIAGFGLGAGTHSAVGATGATGRKVAGTARYLRDIGYEREASAQSPEQTASDLRVGKMFDDMKRAQARANTGTTQADDVSFKKVQDRVSAEIKSSVKQLYDSDQIDKATYDRLIGRKDNILKQADQHNRDLSQEDLDVLQSLPLEEPVKQGLINSFRDLNTITNAAMKKNAQGPLERATRAVLPVVSGGVGWHSPPAGIAMLAGQGMATAGARKLDNLLGLQQPEILRRIRVVQRRNQAAKPADTMHFLSDLAANAQAGVSMRDRAATRESAAQRLLRAKRRMNDNPGLNGFDRYIYDQTGLLPSEVDKGLLKLVERGDITTKQQKNFYQAPNALKEGNQGNVIMDMLNDMAVQGVIQRAPEWQGLRPEGRLTPTQGGTSGIRNLYAYRQTMANVADATQTAQQSAPTEAMRQAVNDIANARTQVAKQALFAQVRAANPAHRQWLDDVVAPITKFGPKNDQASSAAPVGALPGAPGSAVPTGTTELRDEGVEPSVRKGYIGHRVEEVPMSTGLDARVSVNPTAREARAVFGKAKDGVVRAFVDDDGNLFIWDAFDLSHGEMMDHYGFEDYSGAFAIHSVEEAERIAQAYADTHRDGSTPDTRSAPAQISWESIPGRTSTLFPEMHSAPLDQRMEYHKAISQVFLSEDGRDIVADELGLPSEGAVEAPGFFEGNVNPGTQTLAVAPHKPGAREVTDEATDLIEAYAAVKGILLKQDAMAWHRPFYDPSDEDANGIEIRVGRPLTEDEVVRVAEAMQEATGQEFAPVSTSTGARLLNGEWTGIDNKRFAELTEQALQKALPDENVQRAKFHWTGNLFSNDWSKDREGQAYLDHVKARRPDLLGKVRGLVSQIQPRVEAVNQDFSRRYGWTGTEEHKKRNALSLNAAGLAALSAGTAKVMASKIANKISEDAAADIGDDEQRRGALSQ